MVVNESSLTGVSFAPEKTDIPYVVLEGAEPEPGSVMLPRPVDCHEAGGARKILGSLRAEDKSREYVHNPVRVNRKC